MIIASKWVLQVKEIKIKLETFIGKIEKSNLFMHKKFIRNLKYQNSFWNFLSKKFWNPKNNFENFKTFE